jgi:hypothetical protein
MFTPDNKLPLYQNIKRGTVYEIIGGCVNRTNAQDGQRMILYRRVGETEIQSRETHEFYRKFFEVE